MQAPRLYHYAHSSCSWRVRIVIETKGLKFDYATVDVSRGRDEQEQADYAKRAPMRQVPLLEWSTGGETRRLSQSLAIIRWLEHCYPETSVYPQDPEQAARCEELAQLINAGVQPLQNNRVQAEVSSLGGDGLAWAQRWIAKGLAAFEALLAASGDGSGFCVGQAPSVADACLIPQLANAEKFGVDLNAFPRMRAIGEHCQALPSFQRAHPSNWI